MKQKRKTLKTIDHRLLDIYPEYNQLMKWWQALNPEVQVIIKDSAEPPVRYKRLTYLHRSVVSLLNTKRRLQGGDIADDNQTTI